MSELTRCNYCTLRDLRRFAEDTNQRLELVPDIAPPKDDPQDPDEELMDIRGTSVIINGSFAAWLWVISDHCVCYE